MKTFLMSADSPPKNATNWFDGFAEGKEIKAESRKAAQLLLNKMCQDAGTISDPYWATNGPMAEYVGDLK